MRRCLRFARSAYATWLPKAQGCWVSNPEDRRHPGLAAAHWLPNIPWLSLASDASNSEQKRPDSPGYLLFVGSLGYSANREAMDWFLRSVWPEVKSTLPDLKLAIIGGGLPTTFQRRWQKQPGIQVVGRVACLNAWYTGAAAVIAPIQSGAGTNIKVLEAASHGKCLIVTPAAVRGLSDHFHHPDNCLLAEDAKGFVRHIIAVIQNPERAAQIGHSALDVVNAHFTPQVFESAVRGLIQKHL
ncbi:MAG: glycosyltransferase family 4 protein [Verrucomicrobia bacterium]|nr:glycosyltransferase family 4 protein [Verrucomicrobiota bacterium]